MRLIGKIGTAATVTAALAGAGIWGQHAQAQGRQSLVTLQAAAAPNIVTRSSKGVMTLVFTVRDGYHINAVKPGNPDLIAATLELKPPAGITLGTPRFPMSESATLPGMSSASQVYTGKKVILVPFTVAKTAKPGPRAIGATLGFQGCNDTTCLPPDSVQTRAAFVVK